MDKENLKRAFGEEGDFGHELAEIFGKAYLDYPDTSKENLPAVFKNEPNFFNVGEILKRAIEISPNINCFTNQIRILRHLQDCVSNTSHVSHEEWFAVMKHIEACNTQSCHNLYGIAILDTKLTPEQMKKLCNETIRSWKME